MRDKTPDTPRSTPTADVISGVIVVVRDHRVILDRDLAAIYGVSTSRLNEAVKRNAPRFPKDFMFRLTREEAESSRSQIAILNGGRGRNIKYLPYAFTEHGAIQAANVLRKLMRPEPEKRRGIGFTADLELASTPRRARS